MKEDCGAMMKLREIVDMIVSDAQRAYDIADDYCCAGTQLSHEDYSELVSNMLSFPYYTELLNDMSSLHFSDYDSDEHRISEIKTLVEELIDRITVIKVIYTDLIKLITYPHDGNEIKFGLLTGLSIQMNTLLYKRDALMKLANENLPQTDTMIEEDEENSSCSIKESDAFYQIYSYVQDVFPLLANHSAGNRRSLIELYQKYILQSLNEFSEGNDLSPFSFSINHRVGEESQWIDFTTDGNSIIITDSGYVYDPQVGGDTYTNWSFTLFNDGETDGTCWLSVDETVERINCGAELMISEPDEFIMEDE